MSEKGRWYRRRRHLLLTALFLLFVVVGWLADGRGTRGTVSGDTHPRLGTGGRRRRPTNRAYVDDNGGGGGAPHSYDETPEERIQNLLAEVKRLEDKVKRKHGSEGGSSSGGVDVDVGDNSTSSSSTAFADTVDTDGALSLLPSCNLLMQQPYSAFADGAFLARHTTDIRWVMRADGSRQLELQEICRLKRYTAGEARQCLGGKHLAIVGDSLSRYQYLSLAYLLEYGTFPPRFARPGATPRAPCLHVDEYGRETCSPHSEPNVCVEADWGNWDAYYDSLCGGTDGGVLNGHLECHSYRVKPQRKNQQLECHENFLYVSGPHPNSTATGRATLSFVFETGWGDNLEAPLYGFNFTNCSYDGSCRRTEEDKQHIKDRTLRRDYDWKQPFPEAIGTNGTLRDLLPRPDFALYNRGVWGRLHEDRARTIFPILHDWVAGEPGRAQQGKCFFKSTTAGASSFRDKYFETELKSIRPHVMYAGCHYLDFAYLTEPFAALDYDASLKDPNAERKSVFVDQVHLQPWVYEELNHVLLNVICNNEKLQ